MKHHSYFAHSGTRQCLQKKCFSTPKWWNIIINEKSKQLTCAIVLTTSSKTIITKTWKRTISIDTKSYALIAVMAATHALVHICAKKKQLVLSYNETSCRIATMKLIAGQAFVSLLQQYPTLESSGHRYPMPVVLKLSAHWPPIKVYNILQTLWPSPTVTNTMKICVKLNLSTFYLKRMMK